MNIDLLMRKRPDVSKQISMLNFALSHAYVTRGTKPRKKRDRHPNKLDTKFIKIGGIEIF